MTDNLVTEHKKVTDYKRINTYFEPKLLTMNEVAQMETRSGRSDRTINIRCNSLHAFSHSPEIKMYKT